MEERPLGGLEFEHEFQSRDFPRLVYSLKRRSHGGWPAMVARGRAWTKAECPNISIDNSIYSGLILAARITLRHLSVSSTMSFANSAAEIGITIPPSSSSRSLTLEATRTALLSLSTISVAFVLVCQPRTMKLPHRRATAASAT
jgi:hypothetical protein